MYVKSSASDKGVGGKVIYLLIRRALSEADVGISVTYLNSLLLYRVVQNVRRQNDC